MEAKLEILKAAANGAFKDAEVAFVRKRDKQLITVKVFELMREFKSVDFINDEISLNGEVFILSSFQNKPETVILTVLKNASGGDGSYYVNGTKYTDNREFQVTKNTSVEITLQPEANSYVDSVVDSNGAGYIPNNNIVSIPMAAQLSVTITFKSKAI